MPLSHPSTDQWATPSVSCGPRFPSLLCRGGCIAVSSPGLPAKWSGALPGWSVRPAAPPTALAQRNPDVALVNVKRTRRIGREYHDWDLASEGELVDERDEPTVTVTSTDAEPGEVLDKVRAEKDTERQRGQEPAAELRPDEERTTAMCSIQRSKSTRIRESDVVWFNYNLHVFPVARTDIHVRFVFVSYLVSTTP